MIRNSKSWENQYKKKDALWIHDENPIRPHALLTSGNHSNGFFNSRLIIEDSDLLFEAAADLLELAFDQDSELGKKIQYVVGPQTGATKLAELVCYKTNRINRNEDCNWTSPKINKKDQIKTVVLSDSEIKLLPKKQILLCEDVITTGGSIEITETALLNVDAEILPFILALVNRSGLKEIGGKKIIALVDHHMPIWTPEECPLCKVKSESIRPKDNWEVLNATYASY